ncbi:unnamed protein product [Ascophyllum nodosum]
MGRCGQITKHHRWLIEGRKPSFSIRLTTMKMGVALIRVLTLLTFISDVSARAGALASASSGGLLHSAAVSSGGKQVAHEASTVPAISDLERFSADVLEGDIAKAAVELSGGKEVLQRHTSTGVLGVLGGALCHLVLGTVYCWGNFVAYVPKRLQCFADAPGCAGASYVLPGIFVAQMLTMPFSPYFQEKIGCQATTLLGCGIMALGVFLSSFAPNLSLFMLCYSLLFGAGVGIAYTAPMVNGWRWFPNKKGLVSGAVVAGFGCGGFVFNQVGTKIINPNGLNAVSGVYPDEVYVNFPVMLRKLSLIYIVTSCVGALAIRPPPPAETLKNPESAVESAAVGGVGVREALKDQNFWLMWFMVLMIGTSGINVANCYKQYGGTVAALQSDNFQSLVGSVAALCNGGGRLFWGNMLDTFGFKRSFSALAVLQTTATAFYTMLSQSKSGFLFGTGLLLSCLGGNFAMFPALTSKVFGGANGAKIYGVIFSAFALASISGTFLTKSLMSNLNWEWEAVFKLMAFLSFCSVFALPFFEVY